MKITASRLSQGNKIFPAEIDITDNGLNLRIPGLFKDKTTYFSFSAISSVSIDTPLIGYSTIHISAQGSTFSIHGFTKSEVKQIKSAIEAGVKE